MPLEEKLYKTVEEFTRSKFKCGHSKQQVGTKLGKVDVVGVREIHGNLETHVEVNAFEVKEESTSFLSSIGQARAYSIYAHKCYLAYRKRRSNEFTLEEIDIASQLGVGLIEIRNDGCEIVATSSTFTPRDSYVLEILFKLGLFRCTMCHAVYPLKDLVEVNPNDVIDLKNELPYAGQMKKAIINQKNLVYYLYRLYEQREDQKIYVYDRRYICKDCASIFASLIDKGK